MQHRAVLIVCALVALFLPSQASSGQVETRSALEQPFPWDSIWNMPIGDGANYVDAQIDAGRDFGVFADEDILILRPDAPLVDVLEHDADWDPSKERCDSIVSPTQVHLSQVPVPADFSTEQDNEGTPNAAAAILMPDGETIRQTQPLHVCGPGGPVVSQYLFPDANIRTDDGRAGAHGGASMSSIGGTIRVGELVPGALRLPHALKVVIDSQQYTFFDGNDPTPGFRWPAFSSDRDADFGYGGSVPAVEMGALLALRPNFDVESLRTEPARIIARTMRDYGGYLVDSSGWDAHYFATEFGPDGRVIDQFEQTWGWPYMTAQVSTCGNEADPACAWSKDMGDIFEALHVVDNNSPSTIGGPGERRAPCAAAFADGTGGAPPNCSPNGGPAPTPPPAAPTCDGLTANIFGTSGPDVLIGTRFPDVIAGLGGDDVISGRGANDVICGGGGDDQIFGNNGRDRIFGGSGDDQISGNKGRDRIFGGAGNDVCRGGKGADKSFGCEDATSTQ